MRSHEEMMELILRKASDERVRLVTLEGSRAGRQADEFSDYDVTFFVREMSFDDSFIEDMGEILILQKPDPMPALPNAQTYLMMYQDGNRIDLKIAPISDLSSYQLSENYDVIIDKDAVCKEKKSRVKSYEIKEFTYEEACECVNEFYWISLYVLKGIFRNHRWYAYKYMNLCIEECLKMISFEIFTRKKETLKLGKCYHDIETYVHLSKQMDEWMTFAETFQRKQALLSIMKVFYEASFISFQRMNWELPEEAKRVMEYVENKIAV